MNKRIELTLSFSYDALFNNDLKRLLFGVNSLKKYRKIMNLSQYLEYIDLKIAAKKMQLIRIVF